MVVTNELDCRDHRENEEHAKSGFWNLELVCPKASALKKKKIEHLGSYSDKLHIKYSSKIFVMR